MDPPVASWRRLTFIEPVVFCIMFSFAISDSVITDQIVYKTCIKMLKGNSSNCSILYENSSSDAAKVLQELIQPNTATVLASKSSIETLFPIILCLFLGPWSDTNGRKPLLIFPFIGSIIYYSLFSILSIFSVDPHWFLLASIISSVMGGFPSILLTCFCYVADVTNSENRAWRLGFLDFVLFGGQLVGFLVSPVLFRQFGYCTVFAVSAFSCVLGLLYSYFLLKETIYTGTGTSLKSLFDITLMKDLIRTVTKKRSGFDRCLIWCCLIIIALHDDMMQGTATIVYLFTKRFGLSLFDFSFYSVIQLSVTMSGMMLIKVIAPLLSKVSAVTVIMEKIGPLATTPIFVLLYTNFIKEYPCPVWFLPAAFSSFIVILAIVVEKRWRKLKSENLTC